MTLADGSLVIGDSSEFMEQGEDEDGDRVMSRQPPDRDPGPAAEALVSSAAGQQTTKTKARSAALPASPSCRFEAGMLIFDGGVLTSSGEVTNYLVALRAAVDLSGLVPG